MFYPLAVPAMASSFADRCETDFHAVAASEGVQDNRYSASFLNLVKLLLCSLWNKGKPLSPFPVSR